MRRVAQRRRHEQRRTQQDGRRRRRYGREFDEGRTRNRGQGIIGKKERVIEGRNRAGECRRPGDRRGHKVVDGQGLKGSENAQVDVARYLVKIVERRGTGAAGELGLRLRPARVLSEVPSVAAEISVLKRCG